MVFSFLKPFATRAATDSPPLKTAPDGRPLRLVFSDDFQTFRPWTGHSGIWQTTFAEGAQPSLDRRGVAGDRESELDLGSGAAGCDPFSVDKKGVLEITAVARPGSGERGKEENVTGYPYMSGLISTEPSFAQTYGYFEMRAELPQGKGLWPAFWMLPKDQSWPPEIDIVESIGDPSHVYMTAHSKHLKSAGIEAHIAPHAFHTFAVGWDREQVIWYIDGSEAGRVRTPDDMHKSMYLLANLAVGGHWPGSPDTTTRFPAKLMIDYIRAYRFDL
jgi:hypothetical protein